MARLRNLSPTVRCGTWISLGDNDMVRLVDLGAEYWTQNFSTCQIAYSGYGGLVAIYEKGSRQILLHTSTGIPNKASSSIQIPGNKEFLFFCWSGLGDHLLFLLNDGSIHVYDYRGDIVSQPIMLDSVPQLCRKTGNGLVAFCPVSGKGPACIHLVDFSERDGYVSKRLQLPSVFQKTVPVSDILVIPKEQSGEYPEVYIPFPSTPFFSAMYHCVFGAFQKCTDLRISISGGGVKKMSYSKLSKKICFLMEDGSLFLTNRLFQELTKIIQFEDMKPYELSWCGEKCAAVLCSSDVDYSSSIFIVNTEEPDLCDYIYDLPPSVHFLPECDGTRLLGDRFYQFLQVVPHAARRIFTVGSRSPSALLLTTFDEFMAGNARAATMIRELQRNVDSLIQAINDCVVAASFEVDTLQQKRLLRIAAFGKTFCPLYDSDLFINTANRIRVRNTLKTGVSGMLISHEQFVSLGEERILARLASCNCHQIAQNICTVLEINNDPVMMDWMLTKLRNQATSRADIAKLIVKKLKLCGTTAFSEFARLANLKGFRVAALLLLEAETNPIRQIPTLLSIGEPDTALQKASQSGNTDLLFTAVQYIIGSRRGRSVDAIIRDPPAKALLLRYVSVSEVNRDILAEYFRQNPDEKVLLHLKQYLDEVDLLKSSLSKGSVDTNWETQQECKTVAIQAAIMTKGKSSKEFSQENASEKYLRMHLSLIEEQTKLMRELNDFRFLTASVIDMIQLVLEHGKQTTAKALKNKYHISDKSYQWCMLNAYSCTGQWELIDELGGINSNTTSLISAESFANVLLNYNRTDQARRYISRISSIVLRMEYYVQCSDWVGAGADCKRSGESDLFLQLKERAKGNPSALSQLDEGWNSQQGTSGGLRFSNFFS